MIKRLKAFTLSEVLIALGTIGVVATLILPQLVTGHKAATAKAQFSTAYALLTKSFADMDIDNNTLGLNAIQNPVAVYERLKEYNRVTIDCGTSANPANTSVCPIQSDRKTLNRTDLADGIVGSFVINNGMAISVGMPLFQLPNTNIRSPLIYIDLNGKNKRPNRLGYDIFSFQITATGEIAPAGAPNTTHQDNANNIDLCCIQSVNNGCRPRNAGINGITCALFASTDEEYFNKVYRGF